MPRVLPKIMPLRILIADDSRVVRHSLHGLLEQHPGWEVCAEAVDGADAVDKAQECAPDIILLDFFMPGMTGVEAAQVLGRVLPSVPILLVTVYVTSELVKQAKAAGIKVAAPKSDTQEILNGIEAVMNRKTFFEGKRIEPVGEACFD
jgi:DNA-binding NarL/FixJ family response regulator